MNKTILKNYHSYHVPSQSHRTTRPRNAVFISAANSIKHELFNCIGAIMVQRFGDVFFNPDINKAIEDLVFDINLAGGTPLKEKNIFISEAVPNNRPNRRIDLVNINTLDEFEFENIHTIKKEGAVTIYIWNVLTVKKSYLKKITEIYIKR